MLHVERGEGCAAGRHAGDLGQSGDRVVVDVSGSLGADRVADGEVLLRGGHCSDRDLPRPGGPAAGGQGERGEALVRRVDAEAELRSAVADCLAVRSDQLHRREEEATGGGLDSGHGLDAGDQ